MFLPIQTYWEDRSTPWGGWLDKKYQLFSWALSSILIHRNLAPPTLYTNSKGADVLIGDLMLPYVEVKINLEGLTNDFPQAWVMNKLNTYACQNHSFVHIDGDVYIIGSVFDQFHWAVLLAQNLEFDHQYYKSAYQLIHNSFKHIPICAQIPQNHVWAANAGIIGGSKIEIFKELFSEAQTFLRRNADKINEITPYELNIYLEQYLFKQLADYYGYEIDTIINRAIGPNEDYGLNQFPDLPLGRGYLHAMNSKQDPSVCEQIAQRLLLEDPILYERCNRIAQRGQLHSVYVIEKSSFPRTLKAIHTAIAIFDETLFNKGEKEIKECLNSLRNEDCKALLLDIFALEKAGQTFKRSLPSENARFSKWLQQSLLANSQLGLGSGSFLKSYIALSDYCLVLSSDWNWAMSSDFINIQSPNTYNINHGKEIGYFEYIVFYSPSLNAVRENLLDPISMLLFEKIRQRQRIDLTIRNVIRIIKKCQPNVDISTLKSLIVKRIRFYLYSGVLKFVD